MFAGLIRFSDGILQGGEPTPLNCTVVIGQPDPSHKAFYPSNHHRMFYHQNYGAIGLNPLPGHQTGEQGAAIAVGRGVQVSLEFRESVRRGTESASVLPSAGGNRNGAAVSTGGRRHNSNDVHQTVGAEAGPRQTGRDGSVHITVERLELRGDPKDHYHSVELTASVFEGDAVGAEIDHCTQAICERTDSTMQHLRAMRIYGADDPRDGKLNYPTFAWFIHN